MSHQENEYHIEVVENARVIQSQLSQPKFVGGAPSYEISDIETIPSPLNENDRNVKFFSASKNQ